MIAYLIGKLAYADNESIIVDVNGVGYELKVTSNVLNNSFNIGEEIKVYTFMSVREDGVSLFGFDSKDELNLFKMLITVSGIGPKGAIGILSTLSADELRFAILADDSKTIARSPGIGAKTASKLILELKDKLKLTDAFESKYTTLNNDNTMSADNDNNSDAIMALVALGYSNSDAYRAVRKVSQSGMTTEDIIKRALTVI